jgi:hypothetical protein
MSLLDLLRGLLGRSKMVCVACLHAHTGTTTKAEMAAAASADANRPMSVKPVRKRACGRRSAVCRCAARSPYSCVIDPRTTKDAVAQVFSAFDAAKCGRISASDFRKALVFLGAEKHQDRAVRLLMSACAHKHTNTHTPWCGQAIQRWLRSRTSADDGYVHYDEALRHMQIVGEKRFDFLSCRRPKQLA